MDAAASSATLKAECIYKKSRSGAEGFVMEEKLKPHQKKKRMKWIYVYWLERMSKIELDKK